MVCHFCENIFKRNRALGLPEKDSVVYEDNHIYVMPDICPLAVGHMLIITKSHYQGYASAEENVLHSVEKFLHYYEEKIGGRNYTIFEHGAVIPYTAGASVDHAHLHIVPFELRMHGAIKKVFPHYKQRELKELREFAEIQQPYLFYKLKSDEKGYVYPVGKMKSQFLRKAAAELIQQKKGYDWKKMYQEADASIDFIKTLAWWKSLSFPMTFKWKKKLILEKYNLLKYYVLLNEVHRFKPEDREIIISLLEKELYKTEERQRYSRLIAIPSKHQYKLPNYIVSKENDLTGAKKFLEYSKDAKEIWHLTGQTEQNDAVCRYCFSGRISDLCAS